MNDKTLFQKESDLFQNTNVGMYYCGKRIETINHVYGPEIRNYYLFVLVNKGEASFFHKNGTQKLKAHDMLIMCPGEKIHYKAETPWSIQWVGLYGQTVENYMKTIGVDGDHPILRIEEYYEMEQVLEALYQICGRRAPEAQCRQMELIYHFLSILMKKAQGTVDYDIAESAKKIIDYNFGRQITIGEISKTIHLDAAYVARKFAEKFGISPKEYLMEKRIDYAKKLLTETDASVKEIAASIGYLDQLYFSRVFKKKVGVSPVTYRIEKRAGRWVPSNRECLP